MWLGAEVCNSRWPLLSADPERTLLLYPWCTENMKTVFLAMREWIGCVINTYMTTTGMTALTQQTINSEGEQMRRPNE